MRNFYSIFILLIFTSCYNTERNCADFKTGTFQFNYIIDGVEKTGKFVRNDSLSIDYYDGKADTSSVRWINDCEFILKKLNPNSLSEKEPIHMKILSTTKDSYVFEYKHAIKKANRDIHVETGIAKKID
ncbi:hypothetical protein [Winogradskyella sp. SYSU M77433]|uniref:hypothetical protein n=1 Tax=Winogradskyella sp. SYSU M77433 TaxID=3042722 RepID=UPI00248135D6|nr:hypothetical protein [Winogradskyella sp. SYSU M77433]MDH7913974.1 hypothetical protein [Winogradskyella sp. SYSU M77433]